MTPNVIMQSLIAMQEIQFGAKPGSPANKEALAALQAKIPPNILGHYDRLVAKGKKGCAGVTMKSKVCLECRVSIPIGTVITVMKALDLQLCGSCGRYLYMIDETPATPPGDPLSPPAPKKRARKPRAQDSAFPSSAQF